MKKIILSGIICAILFFSPSDIFAQQVGATTSCECSVMWGLSSCKITCSHKHGAAACITIYGMCQCVCGGAYGSSTTVSTSNCSKYVVFLEQNLAEHVSTIMEIFNNHLSLDSGKDIELEAEEYESLLNEYKDFIERELNDEDKEIINNYFLN